MFLSLSRSHSISELSFTLSPLPPSLSLVYILNAMSFSVFLCSHVIQLLYSRANHVLYALLYLLFLLLLSSCLYFKCKFPLSVLVLLILVLMFLSLSSSHSISALTFTISPVTLPSHFLVYVLKVTSFKVFLFSLFLFSSLFSCFSAYREEQTISPYCFTLSPLPSSLFIVYVSNMTSFSVFLFTLFLFLSLFSRSSPCRGEEFNQSIPIFTFFPSSPPLHLIHILHK